MKYIYYIYTIEGRWKVHSHKIRLPLDLDLGTRFRVIRINKKSARFLISGEKIFGKHVTVRNIMPPILPTDKNRKYRIVGKEREDQCQPCAVVSTA